MMVRPCHRIILLAFIGQLLAACSASSVASSSESTSPAATVEITPADINLQPLPTNIAISASPTLAPASSPTAIVNSTATPFPTATTSRPTAVPLPAMRQLTEGGCCTQPFFSPDSHQVLFIDKPTVDSVVGIYGVDIVNRPAAPTLVNNAIGFRSPDRTIVATVAGNLLRFTNEADGTSWTMDTNGNWPQFSPDATQVLWVASDREGPYDQRQNDIWLAELRGSNPRRLLTLFGGGFAGWFPNGQDVLLLGRDVPGQEERTLIRYNVETGSRTNLYSHKRLRGGDISGGGSWIAYFLSFSDDQADNGLWIINAGDATRRKLDVPGFGIYRWRDDHTLLYIPFRNSPEDSMQLWSVDVATGQVQPLTDPTTLSFSISNGDWDISPDGRNVVFVNSLDQNIWLITLP